MPSSKITEGMIIEGIPKVVNPTAGIFETMFVDSVSEIDYDRLARIMESYAKEGHKSGSGVHYKNRTNKLVNATTAKYDKKNNQIVVGADGGKVRNSKGKSYVDYVRYGHGTWNGDDFIKETIDNNFIVIQKEMQVELDKGIDRVNSSREYDGSIWVGLAVATRIVGRVWRMFKGLF